MYQRVLTGWALDLLRSAGPAPGPTAPGRRDGRPRQWDGLYSGNILDD